MSTPARGRIVHADVLSPRMLQLYRELHGDSPVDLITRDARPDVPLATLVRGAHALITRSEPIDATIVRAAGPTLKLIQVHGRLPDRVDLAAARASGVPVAVMPSGGAIAVAEQTLALMLALARRIVPGHNATVSGGYRSLGLEPVRTSEAVIAFNWMKLPIAELHGKAVGLVGFGQIGQEVALRAGAFGMQVRYYQRRRLAPPFEAVAGATWAPFDDLVREADYVSLHAPHTAGTERLIDAAVLGAMKPTAFLINTARGGLVDEPALVEALRSGRIAGAGLDVFVQEPVPADHPILSLDNVVLAPHVGGGSGGGHRGHVGEVLANVLRAVRGEPVLNRVDETGSMT